MHLHSRTIQTPYTDISVPPAALPARSRKRMILDCVELPSASACQSTAMVPCPPGDEEPSVSSHPNQCKVDTTGSASRSSTLNGNGQLASPKETGPDSIQAETLSPQQPTSATTSIQPVCGVPGLVQTVHRDGQVTMDFGQVRHKTWFDHDRARQQREAAIASTSRRQLTPVADEVDTFPWDAREERINELQRHADSTVPRPPPSLPPSSPPAQSPSPPVTSPAHEKGLPHVSSPVQGEDSLSNHSDHSEDEQAKRGNRKGVTFMDDIDIIEEEFEDDDASDNCSDDAHQEERLRKQKNARLAHQRKRNQDHSVTLAQPGPKSTSTSLPAAKQPSKQGRKPKNPPVADLPDDEDDDGTPLLDPVLDPDCPEYKLDADAYDTPGPLSNECRRELAAAAYEFETCLHELACKYQKSMGSLLQAAGYGFKTHRKDSTWNDFQAFQTKKNGEKPRPNETLQEFVARMSTEYKEIMKSELGDNWKNIDHRRELAKKLGWVGYTQQA
ncbi:hypothetical protein VKT23_016215 [Stygiomarasmius scandens]|uniref:Uncharacterized protein n=1 Tax=Marasmiellus scandens TaxID=2682957 RepID=A0ABR1IVS3_9AGAR